VSYKQIVGFNPAIAGTTKYLCLSNVRKGYGIAAKYASAWQAWQNTQQHTDAIPGVMPSSKNFSATSKYS
jgi:hypothetical protein